MSISVFEIIGPVMIGPSSSHTAGMARIGRMTNRIVDEDITAVHLSLSPMLKNTYRGHRTDAALIGGAIGLRESSPDIRNAIDIAHNRGIATDVDFLSQDPCPQNTALVEVDCLSGRKVSVLGTSVGGGSIAIRSVDGVKMDIAADAFHLVIWSDAALPDALLPSKVKVQSGGGEGGWVTCITFPRIPEATLTASIRDTPGVRKVSVVSPVLEYGVSLPTVRELHSCEEACAQAVSRHISLAEVAVQYEMSRSGFSRAEIRSRMADHLRQIKASVQAGSGDNHLLYGLASGRDSKMLMQKVRDGTTISGGIIPLAVARALGVMEYNGSMGCIVAAPTAGSSGIVPGCMTTVQEAYRLTDDQLVDALFVSGLMGVIMAGREVSFSGSVGGCQGEVGVSSAISAAGLASLFTMEPRKIVHAMAICLKNLLGLVCDPIAGPIEIPCIKRNAVGVGNAFISADMALAGIESFIPPDEVIDALVDVERRLPQELKCATVGGLASTCTAKRVRKELSK